MSALKERIDSVGDWMSSSRFDGILRLYSPREVAEQQGTIANDYPIARQAAEGFFDRLRQLFDQHEQITSFGPYSPGQAVTMKRQGNRRDLSRRLGDLRQGIGFRGSGR